jgi:hypothetical protein
MVPVKALPCICLPGKECLALNLPDIGTRFVIGCEAGYKLSAAFQKIAPAAFKGLKTYYARGYGAGRIIAKQLRYFIVIFTIRPQ